MEIPRDRNGKFITKRKLWSKEPIPKETIIRIIELHYDGMSVRSISKAVQVYDKNNKLNNIPKTTVHKIVAGLPYKPKKP